MKSGNKSLLMATIAGLMAALTLVGCGTHNCSAPIPGTTGGGSGTPAGFVSTSVCGAGAGSGGGGGIGGGSSSALVYYLTSKNVEAAGLSNSGTFANVSPFTPPPLSGSFADDMTTVKKQFVYIPFSDISAVEAFTINRSTGALTAIAGSPFAASAGADVAVSDPKGRFLFIGGEGTGNVTVFQINATSGALTPSPGNPFSVFNLSSADSLIVDSTGQFLYVGQQNPNAPVHAFIIDQNNGSLSPVPGSPFNIGASILQADPAGNLLFGVSDEFASNGDKSIHVFAIDATSGSLSPVSGQPFATTNAGFSLAVHPSGKFLYALTKASASGNDSAMEGFQINAASGALSPLAGSPFVSLPTAELCRFDQSGSEMICDDVLGGSRFMVFTTNPNSGAVSHTVKDLSVSSNFPFAVTD